MSLTLAEMNNKIADLRALSVKEKDLKDALKEVNAVQAEIEAQLIEALMDNQLKNYRAPEGLVSLVQKTSVKTPKTPEAREAFFGWLRERGLYDQLISVNSMTLNALYKEEFEAAALRGDMDFKVPGLEEVTITPSISFRK